jgi:hypothetical protein
VGHVVVHASHQTSCGSCFSLVLVPVPVLVRVSVLHASTSLPLYRISGRFFCLLCWLCVCLWLRVGLCGWLCLVLGFVCRGNMVGVRGRKGFNCGAIFRVGVCCELLVEVMRCDCAHVGQKWCEGCAGLRGRVLGPAIWYWVWFSYTGGCMVLLWVLLCRWVVPSRVLVLCGVGVGDGFSVLWVSGVLGCSPFCRPVRRAGLHSSGRVRG